MSRAANYWYGVQIGLLVGVAGAVVLIACGCSRPRPGPATAGGPPIAVPVDIAVVTDAAGKSNWFGRVETDADTLRRVFAAAGVEPRLTISAICRPEWYNARASVRAEMLAVKSPVRTLWLVNTIDFTDVPVRGFAAFDAFLAYNREACGVQFPHELAHTFGLNHLERPGNVMRGLACGGEDWTPEQIAQLRAAAEAPRGVK